MCLLFISALPMQISQIHIDGLVMLRLTMHPYT